jgi:transcriptional regulator with XRE-family HTH domain
VEPVDGLRDAIAEVVRRRRKEYGIAQESLADKVGLNRSYVGMIERGRQTPSLDVVFAIASGLEIDPWVLVKEIQEEWELGRGDKPADQ